MEIAESSINSVTGGGYVGNQIAAINSTIFTYINNLNVNVYTSVTQNYLLANQNHISTGKNQHRGWSLLHSAAISGKDESVKMVLDLAKIDINTEDNLGLTAYDIADIFDHNSTKILLESRGGKVSKVRETEGDYIYYRHKMDNFNAYDYFVM